MPRNFQNNKIEDSQKMNDSLVYSATPQKTSDKQKCLRPSKLTDLAVKTTDIMLGRVSVLPSRNEATTKIERVEQSSRVKGADYLFSS